MAGLNWAFQYMGHLMKPIITALAAIMLASSPAMADTFYRWVDDNGVTHYAERPPQGHASEAVRTWGAPSSSQGRALEALEEMRSARAEARAQPEAEQAASAPPAPRPPEEYCQQHRRNLEALTQRPIVRRTDPETGEQTTLDASQREAMIADTQDALKACS